MDETSPTSLEPWQENTQLRQGRGIHATHGRQMHSLHRELPCARVREEGLLDFGRHEDSAVAPFYKEKIVR